MPYVDQYVRARLDKLVGELSERIDGPGDLNYAITRLCALHLPEEPGYRDYNEVVGVLECAKLEWYRRPIASYENVKLAHNGDVYE